MQSSKLLWRGFFFILLIVALCGGLALPAVNTRAAPQMQAVTHIVISQVYGGGGNANASQLNDYIELFNPTNSPVSVNGWSIQYAAATATSWQITALTNVSIAAGQYYLVQLGSGGANGSPLPTPDATGTTAMSASAGKVALVNTTTALNGSGCPFTASVVDFVGYGSGADCFEGSGRAAAPSNNATADIRNGSGCYDTDNNDVDFATGATTPRNSASPALSCTRITNVTSSVADGIYTTGNTIGITVLFSDIVNVSGVPTLLLETGATDTAAAYVSGTGSNTLVFNYTVAAGNSSGDLDYVSTNALTLSGGTITGATSGVNLTLPNPGSPGSLGANKNIIIDNGAAPTVTINQATVQADPANTTPINFTVLFSEAINVSSFTTSDITQTGTANPLTWSITDSGNHISFTLSATSVAQSNVTLVPSISAGQVTDLAGTGNLASTSTDNSVTFVDNAPPTVTVNQASAQSDPASALPISFVVVFSEPLLPGTFTTADITQTGTATGITWTITNPLNDQRNFSLQATAVTGAGTLIPSIAANTVTDLAGNNNTASTSTDNTVTFNVTPTGSATSVVISEFRTRGPGGSGGAGAAEDEFVEIYNPTTNPVDISGWIISASNSSGSVQNRATIPAATLLRSGQYYLIAHNSYVIPTGGVAPNLRYGTSITNDGGIALLNSTGEIIDEVGMHTNSFYQEGTTLSPLSGTSNGSYERKLGGTSDSCVDTDNNASDFSSANSGTLHNYASPLSLCGTARPAPTATTTLITGDTPDPSANNGNVSVSVKVTGGSTTPSGLVSITGANTNCTLTLNASGTGSCTVKFTSNGTKLLTATYLGDNTHTSSSDTENHQVGNITTIPTPTRVATAIPPPPLIAINEFVPRPGHDWNNDGVINLGDEYIELLNHGVIDVSLSGYSLDDEVNIGSEPFRLPAITLKPGERRVFYGSETGLLLSDGGDGVRLLKPNGQLGDAYNYRVVRFPDQSYCRLPDNGGADDWNQNCFPTPGLQNSLSGSAVNPPTSGEAENLCPIADTLPPDFVLAECPPFGNNIWNSAYWDKFGWFSGKFLPRSPGKWNVFVD